MRFEDREYIDSAKGVLILSVVLGHSVLASESASVKTFVYSFHVYAFLLIPFILPRKTATRENLLNAAARCLVPYLAVVFLVSIPYAVKEGYSIQQWLWFYVRGVGTGNSNYLKATSGLFLFWFLPVIFWVNILLQVYNSVNVAGKVVLAALFFTAHVLLPAMSWDQKQYYPFGGTHIALYILPVGLLLGYVCQMMNFTTCRKARFVWLVAFGGLVGIMFGQGSVLNLGHLGCPSYETPFQIAIHGSLAIFAVLTLIGFSKDLSGIPYLALIGRRSLYIYLFSQPAVLGTAALCRCWVGLDKQAGVILCGTLSVILGILLGCSVAYVTEMLPTTRILLFPRTYGEWSSVLQKCSRLIPRMLWTKA